MNQFDLMHRIRSVKGKRDGLSQLKESCEKDDAINQDVMPD